ncbi:type II toxin-antitoxin system Phd/YefM family antitoxin [Roseofilum capinflatum]|uniref:DUF2281 domain-containing protein n=1 Tax=Roseofilum capinflatum BLCC-M114 TaxID=3022440 RepID=A0ABT7BFZ8_9CYAN|nr:DUF2281 domain-containing protein [Roseofilum capinflatum]MDJ1177218.1 DUF2281 domain-containing protein [Roseofilum capinflatum BLCC-M114]
MQQVDIVYAQAQIGKLLEVALNGDEIIITRDRQPVLKLSPFSSPGKRRKRGSAKGQITIAPDFDQPLEEFQEYME